MKVFKLVLVFLFVNVAFLSQAQTAADLVGYTWKEKTVAIGLLATAQKNLSADQSYVAPMALPESTSFQSALYQNVQSRIKNGNTDIPTAILDGYNQAKAGATAGEDEQLQAFERLVELLKQ